MPLIGILFYLVLDCAIYFFHLAPESMIEWYSIILITSANLLAVFSLSFFAFKKNKSVIWRMLFYGVSAALLAHCSAIMLSLFVERPFVWRITDDVLMVIADGFLIVGLWQWVKEALSNPQTPTDSGQSMATVAAVFMFFFTSICVIVPAFGLWGDPTYERLINLMLSLMDIIGFAFCIRIVFYHQTVFKKAFNNPISVFAIGCGLICLADPFARFQTLLGTDIRYHWINMVWVLGYLLISNAAWHSRRP